MKKRKESESTKNAKRPKAKAAVPLSETKAGYLLLKQKQNEILPMMQTNVNYHLIQAMKAQISPETNLANTLIDLLYLGKEAIYRRLRGEVPFTLTEAVIISQKMNISLDRLVGNSFDRHALFNLHVLSEQQPAQTYTSILARYVRLFEQLIEDPESEFSTSSNVLPQTFHLNYEALSKFRLFKWMYQHAKITTCPRFEEFELPPSLLQVQKEFVAVTQLFRRTYYIWDREIFPRLLKDILYFQEIGLISEESVRTLQKELFQFIDELEEIAVKGKFHTGQEVQIYISSINFEATYSYVQTTRYHLGLIRIFSINSITARDDQFFRSLKEWIQSLKRYSTLISESGDSQRIRFLNEQRELVKRL